MSNDYKAQLTAAMDTLNRLRGQAVLPQLDRIAHLAESHSDEEMVVKALCQSIRNAHRLDMIAPQIASLHRLHAHYMGNPRYQFARDQVLWYHKWVVESLVENADVPRPLIEEMFTRLDALFTSEHVGLRPSHALRCRTAWMMGRNDEAQIHFDRWQSTPAGKSDDCPACEVNAAVEFYVALQRPAEALAAADPLFRGKMHCEEVPALTYSRLLSVAMNSDKPRLAEGLHRATIRSVRRKRDLLASLARHIIYRSLSGRAQSSRRLAVLALGRAPEVSDYNRFGAWLGCAIWFSILVREGVQSVKLPRQFELASQKPNVPTPEGAAWCLQKARELAARFDTRNGTQIFLTRIQESENLIRAICRPAR